ncbi:MAG: metalloregulator ArsR/SmtB family transcription factor [Planctomycetaceae bacterium]|jgi:ubiquinone/menaquinone biosynthesis C-methylase UbiE|nr:metalloregulator ArsR/SmtB family transcription factor [Planctomycetaceae bacterium]
MSSTTTMIAWMQSLSDPTRSRILRILERSEVSVAELCNVLQLPQSTVSRHLKVLVDDGWVNGRREGTSNWYRMGGSEMPPHQKKLWSVAKNHCLPETTSEQDDARLEQVLDSRRSKTQTFFSTAAGRWDRLRNELFGSRLDAWAIAAALNRSWTVGDLGCGTGTISQTLAPWVHRVIAVDASAAMIQSARKRLKDASNVEIRKGELTTLPIDDESLDLAMMGLVLPYLAEPQRVFREAARASRIDGRLVVLDMLAHDRTEYREELGHIWMGFSKAQISEWLTVAGWMLESFVTIPVEPEVKGTPVFVATAVRTRTTAG